MDADQVLAFRLARSGSPARAPAGDLAAAGACPLSPWCTGCRSHHVSPMLWRYATVAAAAREAVRRSLGWNGPATPGACAGWAGPLRSRARRLWDERAPAARGATATSVVLA